MSALRLVVDCGWCGGAGYRGRERCDGCEGAGSVEVEVEIEDPGAVGRVQGDGAAEVGGPDRVGAAAPSPAVVEG